jgi:hypothetical protein
MIARDVEELYRRHIRSLPRGKRLQLLARVARDLAEPQSPEPESGRSLRDLEGLGAEIWTGIDAQRYVDDLRREWDHRP